MDYKKELEKFYLNFVRKALTKTEGNVTEAVNKFGISRPTLYRILNRNKISPDMFRKQEKDGQ